MRHSKIVTNRVLVLGVALLVLAGCCGRSVALGERFTLWKGEMVTVREAGLIIEIETMIYQQPGSQTPGDGFVDLLVTERGGRETTVTLFAGQKAQVGGYEIHVERLVVGVEGEGCGLVVAR
ncbi:MAG: hypothetical protein JXA14_10735 [Anaerolineae bacterium]|nr:hypothetical protein [Anaerolineae bacterium]